ncbi:MAG: hypothetical protein KGL57_03590 [Burkholderiales bacterium]|nr:hypothetical protein [Burkholderiales bacterium]
MKTLRLGSSLFKTAIASLTLGMATTAAHAGEVYANLGLPGLMLGYAQAINPMFSVRGDFATLGNYEKDKTESGIDYKAKLAFNRLGLFGDYFPFSGGFRLTGGLTMNNQKIELTSTAQAGTLMTVGDRTFVVAPDDRLYVQIKMPSTTPYIGLGWGHQQADKGLGFIADLGATLGKAKLDVQATGTNLGNRALVTQADIDKETQQLRDGVGKITFIPQISLGMNYRF